MAINELKHADNVRVLANGALFDTTRARIVANPGGGNKAFTSDTARDAVNKRIEKKRARLVAGANAVIAEGGKFDGRGGDFVEAIGEALTITALNPDSSQQVKAAEFLFREAGISERQAVDAGGTVSLGGVADLVAELAAFASSIGGMLAAAGSGAAGVVDADVVEDVDREGGGEDAESE